MRKVISGMFPLLAMICSLNPFSVLADTVVLNGLPTVRVTSSSDSTVRETLPESKQHEFRILITKNGEDYIWVTRDNRQLIHTKSGVHDLFIDPRGGGYIKVLDQEFLPESMQDSRAQILYMEHLSLMLTTITYWGVAESFNP